VYTYCMSKKTTPYFFLAFLFAILLFILGIRYGQHVEQINKKISYLSSIPPSPTAAPTNIPLAFFDYEHMGCGVSFLIPNELEKKAESSSSALFSTHANKLGIALSCERKNYIKEEGELSVNLYNSLSRNMRAYEIRTKDTTSYRIFNPKTDSVVTITVSKNYLPLLQKSFVFIK